jgi:hypothetical protein
MSAFDALDGASSTVSKYYSSCVESESNQGGETTANLGAEALNELARTRRRNAESIRGWGEPACQRIFECVFLIGTGSAQSIMASGFTAAQTGRTHDRTRPMLQLGQKVLAKAPSTHDPKRTLSSHFGGGSDRPSHEHRDKFDPDQSRNARINTILVQFIP